MDSSKIIDTLVREIAQGNVLPRQPTWPQLKDALAGNTDLLSLEALEARQEEIQDSFFICRAEQIQKKKRQRTEPSVQTNGPAPPTPPRSRTPSNSSGSDKSPNPKTEEPFQPTLDDVANATSPCVLSIYLESKNKWEGAAFKHCLQDWSYMSSRMVKRYELEILDGRTWLVWRPNDSSETYLTKFVVIDGLKCDFMLGRKSKDEEFNHRETEKAPVRPLNPSNRCNGPFEGPLTHSPVQPTGPNMEFLGKLILEVEKANRMPQQAYTNGYLPAQGLVADDGRSVSTDQDRHPGDTSPDS